MAEDPDKAKQPDDSQKEGHETRNGGQPDDQVPSTEDQEEKKLLINESPDKKVGGKFHVQPVALKTIDEQSELKEPNGDAGEEEEVAFVPRVIRRLNSKKARFSIRSGSVRSRYSRGMSITGEQDMANLNGDSKQLYDDEEADNRSETSYVTVQTTAEQSESNVLAWLNDPGSNFGSSILLASPSYLDIYAETISDHMGDQLAKIAEEPEPEQEPVPEDREAIFDNPEYVDTCEGNLQLAEVARMIAKDKTRYGQLFDKAHIEKSTSDYYRRVFIIAIAWLCLYSSFYGIRNAQSSLGNDRQLSLLAYGALYTLMWFGGACGNPLVAKLRPKYGMSIASIAFIMYPLANFYPSYFTLLPVAVITGFSSGLLWACEGIYMINIASAYALVTDGKLVEVIGKFNSIVFSFFLSSNIVGNLLSSLILGKFYTLPGEEEFLHKHSYSGAAFNLTESPYIQNYSYPMDVSTIAMTTLIPSNETSCGLTYQPGLRPHNVVYSSKKYLFFGINLMFAAIGFSLLFFVLKPLKVARPAGCTNLGAALLRFLKLFTEKRSILLIPLMCYFGIISTLILADYNTAFVSCQYGAGMVGFVVMSAYFFSVIGAFSSGRIVAKIGRPPIFICSAMVSLVSVIWLLVWVPSGDNIGITSFIPLWLWGLSDGILYTQNSGFLGVLFKKKVSEAFTMQSSCLGMAALTSTLLMAYGVMSLTFKVYLAITVNLLATICYVTLELLLKKNMI